MKKGKKAIASILAAASIGVSGPRSSTFQWKAEHVVGAVVGFSCLGLMIWAVWDSYKAEKKRQAEYARRRNMVSSLECVDTQFSNVCYNLVELIPVNEYGNNFFNDLCTDNLNTYYGGSLKTWILCLDSKLDFSSSKLQKIKGICSGYLSSKEISEIESAIEIKQKKEQLREKARLEREKLEHEEKMLEKKYEHEKEILDKRADIAKELNNNKRTKTNINLNI